MGKTPSIHIHRPLRRSNLRPGVRAQGHMLIICKCHLISIFQPASFDLPKRLASRRRAPIQITIQGFVHKASRARAARFAKMVI